MALELNVTRDVEFAPGLSLDVYAVAPRDDAAALIVLHGGGWYEGDKHKDEDLARALANAGYVVFEANYRLAPANPFPAAREDVIAAWRWALASSYRFDRRRSGFFGTSAGGNLAVEAALATGAPAVSWSGPLDLVTPLNDAGAADARDATSHDPQQSSDTINQEGPNPAILRDAISKLVAGDTQRLREASPLFRVTGKSGPIYLANSLNEFVPASGALAMIRALADAGVPSSLELFAGTKHAKGYQDLALGGSLAFLARVLSPSS